MPIISAHKFLGTLFGPVHNVCHHCGSLDLQTFPQSIIFFFIYLFFHFREVNITVDKLNHSRQTQSQVKNDCSEKCLGETLLLKMKIF